MTSIAFCVIEKPYMVWSADVRSDNRDFLTRLDAKLYYRVAQDIIERSSSDMPEASAEGPDADEEIDEQDRKDVSTLCRLMWHHGMETLVMLLGAYMQAPEAVHAYFLKCKTEDAIKVVGFLLREELPKYHRLRDGPFSLRRLLNGIHGCAPWAGAETANARLEGALRNMLHHYVDDKHRSEYNSIKHGLRANHGSFGLAVGIQEESGVPAPPEAMEMIASSQDSSTFDVVKPLANATNQQSRINFMVARTAVTWSLEKVLIELQLISILIHNTASALRIAGGAEPGAVTFHRVADEAVWESYDSLRDSPVPSATFASIIDAREVSLATEKTVFDSYKRKPSGKTARS